MALVDVVYSTAFNGAVVYWFTYDDATGVVQTISVTNNLDVPVTTTSGAHALTFAPGATSQNVFAFGFTVSKTTGAWNFKLATAAPG